MNSDVGIPILFKKVESLHRSVELFVYTSVVLISIRAAGH